jgi:hypothetical protein
VAAGSVPARDAGTAAGGHGDEADAWRGFRRAELRDQGDALAGRHQGQHGGEVVGMVADARREARGLAGADHHGVAQSARAARDPRCVTQVVNPGVARPPARGRQVQGLFKQRFGVESGVRLGRHVVVDEGERDVERSRVQRAGNRDRVKLGDHELKSRVLAAKRDEGGGQDRARRRGERADAQPAGQAVSRRGQRGRRLFKDREHGLRVAGEHGARRGERDAPARALEQRHPRLPFERGKLLRYGGRGVRERVGDRGDRAPVR